MKISDLFSLKGRTAVVSAGARNFGFYFAQALAEAGATVHLTSRTLSEATKAAQELKQQTGAEVYGHRVDPAEESSVVDFFREVESRSGRCDVLVNNAGGRPPSPLHVSSTEAHVSSLKTKW